MLRKVLIVMLILSAGGLSACAAVVVDLRATGFTTLNVEPNVIVKSIVGPLSLLFAPDAPEYFRLSVRNAGAGETYIGIRVDVEGVEVISENGVLRMQGGPVRLWFTRTIGIGEGEELAFSNKDIEVDVDAIISGKDVEDAVTITDDKLRELLEEGAVAADEGNANIYLEINGEQKDIEDCTADELIAFGMGVRSAEVTMKFYVQEFDAEETDLGAEDIAGEEYAGEHVFNFIATTSLTEAQGVLVVEEPVGAVDSRTPTFRWSIADESVRELIGNGEIDYRLRVESGGELVWEKECSGGADVVFGYPGDEEPLEPGKTYRLTVSALGNESVAIDAEAVASFTVRVLKPSIESPSPGEEVDPRDVVISWSAPYDDYTTFKLWLKKGSEIQEFAVEGTSVSPDDLGISLGWGQSYSVRVAIVGRDGDVIPGSESPWVNFRTRDLGPLEVEVRAPRYAVAGEDVDISAEARNAEFDCSFIWTVEETGITFTGPDVTFAFENPGDYTLVLHVEEMETGRTFEQAFGIIVLEPLSADIIVEGTPVEGEKVTFVASVPNAIFPVSVSWRIGDKTFSGGQVEVELPEGTYSVRMEVVEQTTGRHALVERTFEVAGPPEHGVAGATEEVGTGTPEMPAEATAEVTGAEGAPGEIAEEATEEEALRAPGEVNISILSPRDREEFDINDIIVATARVTGNANVRWLVDGEVAGEGTFARLTLPQGAHEIKAEAVVGEEVVASQKVYVLVKDKNFRSANAVAVVVWVSGEVDLELGVPDLELGSDGTLVEVAEKKLTEEDVPFLLVEGDVLVLNAGETAQVFVVRTGNVRQIKGPGEFEIGSEGISRR